MKHSGRSILVVEDDPAHAEAIRRAFQGSDDIIRLAGTLGEYVAMVEATAPHIALLDLNLPDGRATDVLAAPPEAGQFPILIMTSFGDEHVAVEAMRAGALDYVVKSQEAFLSMPRTVERALREWGLLQQRKVTEEQLRLAQKMEAVGRLAGGVAHDFNNLLSVILNYAEFANDSLQPGDPVLEDIAEIKKAGKRAAVLTRQLLAFSRKQVLEPRVLNLNHVAAELESMLGRVIGEDIRSVQALAPDLGLVRADLGQIEQVIMNLVVNARDAMPHGGTLTIETANEELDDEQACGLGLQPGSFVMLEISDTGCGMTDETRQRLFEPFFTTKEVGKGTGLGLATVYGIVQQSGGSITVESALGVGTTFRILLPRVHDSLAPQLSLQPSRLPVARGETVLVVEDEDAVRRLAIRILRSAGYTVISAPNGQEALLTFDQHAGKIDLLLTDVIMPSMGGRQLADRLLARSPGLRVLYMSGYTDNAIAHHGVLDPGTFLINKPFDAAQLATKVREVLDAQPSR